MDIYIYLLLLFFTAITSLYVNLSNIKTSKASFSRKLLAAIVILIHDMFTSLIIILNIVILYALLTSRKFKNELLVLNVLVILLVLTFILFKMCALTLLYNKLLGLPRCHAYKFLSPPPKKEYSNSDCTGNSFGWLKTSMIIICICLFWNVCYQIKVR